MYIMLTGTGVPLCLAGIRCGRLRMMRLASFFKLSSVAETLSIFMVPLGWIMNEMFAFPM